MYELKKNLERYWRVNLLWPDHCLMKTEFTGPRSDRGWETCSTQSPFVTLLSPRAQSGRWFSFGKRLWFTESHLILIISILLVVLFTRFIVDNMKKFVLYPVKQLNHILLKQPSHLYSLTHTSRKRLTSLLNCYRPLSATNRFAI